MAAAARNSFAESLLDSAALLADRASGNRLGDWLLSSGQVFQSRSPYDFGVTVTVGSHHPLERAAEVARFTVEEARERLADFLDGSFVAETFHELVEYLGQQFLRLETHILPGGRISNRIVDAKTGQSVPAALVDPRLSHSSILSMQLRASLREQAGTGDPADSFGSWQGMTMVRQNSGSSDGYTVSGGVGWFGRVHATATGDRTRDAEMVRKARERGVELVLPRTSDGRGLVAGMPVLVRSRSMKAAAVHPGLDHGRLSRAFGRGMAETYERLASSRRTASGNAETVDLEAFRRKFARRAVPEQVADPVPGSGFGFAGLGSAEDGPRDLVVRRIEGGGDRCCVFDRGLDEEIPVSPRQLPPGRYERQSPDGVREGYTRVAAGGRVSHEALDGSRVRLAEDSPSPAYGSSDSALPSPRLA